MIFDFVLGALSVWAIVEVVHHSELFSPVRSYLEAKGGFFDRLVACPYCFSHWVAAAVAVYLLLIQLATGTPAALVLRVPLVWLGLTRLSNLANDLTRPFCRTPKEEDHIDNTV